MKTTIRTILLAAVALLIINTVRADGETGKRFQSHEWNLDLYGTGQIANESRSKDDVALGGGVGLTYWVTRGLGFGLRGESTDLVHSAVDTGIGRVIVRAPLWDSVAPYGYASGGFDFERDQWSAGAGGGLDFRFFSGWSFFVEAGLDVTTRGEGSGKGAVGLRLLF